MLGKMFVGGGAAAPKTQAQPGREPFAAIEVPFSSIPAQDTPEYAEWLAYYISEAFKLIRSTPEWKKTKNFNTAVGGDVQCKVLPSQVKELAKKGWHLRESQHGPESGLTYDDWRRLDRFQHSTHEKMYIEDIQLLECVAKVKPDEAEIWRNAYKLPIVTADRDFVQLLLTLDLPQHPQPWSEAHEAATISWIRDPSRTLTPPASDDPAANRSLLILQLPVEHPDTPHDTSMIRGVFCAFEAISEAPAPNGQGKVVDWKMACQSDTRGSIPSVFQEMAMPGEISHDVPAFMEWAIKYKAENPPSEGQ